MGAGTLTFRLLLKSGPANTGEFYYPLNDLVLIEATPSKQAGLWVAGSAVGQTCTDVCKGAGYGVDTTTMQSTPIGEDFLAGVGRYEQCTGVAIGSCSSSAPARDPAAGLCYYKEDFCPAQTRSQDALSDARPLCACGVPDVPSDKGILSAASPSFASPLIVSLLMAASTTALLLGRAGDAGEDGRSTGAQHRAVVPVRGGASVARFIVLLVCLMCALPYSEAHNWLHTPGRATRQASTIAPCQPRKDSDLHAQVTREQYITMKWATGHERNSYMVVVSGKDEHWLAHSKFEDMVDDYISKAPVNHAKTPALQRYHGYESTTERPNYLDEGDAVGTMFQGKINSGSANFLTHPRAPTGHLYQFTETLLNQDQRVSYESTLYPWLESAFRYTQNYHLAEDFDAVQLKLEGRKGDGNYVLHWRWSGYYDCVDIDVRGGSIDVVNKYGVTTGDYVYNRVDHCRYEQPTSIDTACVETFYSAQACIASLPSWKKDFRLGVQVVPFINPPSVFMSFQSTPTAPWSDGRCSSSSWTMLTGTITESDLPGSFAARTKINAGQCTQVLSDQKTQAKEGLKTTFKHAVAECMSHPACKAVSWPGSPSMPTLGAQFTFLLCSSVAVNASNTAWSFAQPHNVPPSVAEMDIGDPISVDFANERASATYSLPVNTYRDMFGAYSTKGALSYGWNCNEEIKCDYCCSSYSCPNDGGPWSMGQTFAAAINYKCPANGEQDPEGGGARAWELAVPNGVYKVDTLHDDGKGVKVGVDGCSVENTRMLASHTTGEVDAGTVLSRRVDVRDGKLTLTGDGGSALGCWIVNTLKVQKVKEQWDENWLDGTSNPFWQMSLPKREPIGVVTIKNLNHFATDNTRKCGGWWLFRGDRCYETMPQGWFNNTETEGAIVGVSDIPCGGGGKACVGQVCGRIFNAPDRWRNERMHVDCKGAEGKYVWVQLPGLKRILAFDVQVNRVIPEVAAAAHTTVCYGVEARQQTSTQPEYTTSYDPADPIFYSTCYVRELNITWGFARPPVGSSLKRWRYHNGCVDCGVYHANTGLLTAGGDVQQDHASYTLPKAWKMAEVCRDCDIEPIPPATMSDMPSSSASSSSSLLPPSWPKSHVGGCDDRKHTCTEGTCVKKMYAPGRHPPKADDSWDARHVSREECQALVYRDAECGDTFMHQNDQNGRYCRCYKATACCGECTPSAWDTHNTISYHRPSAVINIADPTCANNATKTADNTACCPGYCFGQDGKSVCGTRSDTGWRCHHEMNHAGGTCCVENFVRKCDVQAAPCLL